MEKLKEFNKKYDEKGDNLLNNILIAVNSTKIGIKKNQLISLLAKSGFTYTSMKSKAERIYNNKLKSIGK